MPGASGGGHSSGGSHVGATKKGGPAVPAGVNTQRLLVQPMSSAQVAQIRQNVPQPARILGTKGGRITPPTVRRVASGPRFTGEF